MKNAFTLKQNEGQNATQIYKIVYKFVILLQIFYVS